MKRFLPIIISCIAIIFFSRLVFGSTIHQASAQTPSVSPSPTIVVSLTPTPTTPSSLEQNQVSPAELPSDWIIDPEVTNIGKNAARAGIFLDWALQNYDWSYVQPGQANPLTSFWATIRNIVYAFLVLVVIAGSLVLIITRGRSVTLRRFIPRFLAIVILVTFSFAFVEFLYQVVDVFQGFFIRPGGVAVSQKDLLYIGWKYQPFVGLRAIGDENFESAFISLLLVKLTSFTYYAMVGILLVRKIILWFFIMVSPFFPLLLLFYPLRNTAKIWLGEFFRWLLYAPLFAIFLAGLVSLWKTGIPLLFNFSEAGKGIVFPTAISILLGGPLQRVGVANSVNLADTFGLYLVALLMLWMVIVFPFILLQIFLDYLSNINVNQNALARQFVNLLTKFPPQPPGTPPPGYQPTGLARALPFLRDFAIPKAPATTGLAREIPRFTATAQQQQKQTQQQTVVVRPVSIAQKEEVRKLTNISIPTLRDIARFESISLTKDRQTQKDRERVREMLERIANPAQNETRIERERYSSIREKLEKESESGNQLASTVLKAAQQVTSQAVSTVQNLTNITNVINHLANPASISSTPEREKYVEFRETLIKEQEKNTFASSVLSAMQTITMSSKNTLQSLAQTLSHPQEVPERLKETVFDLKETLKKESEKGQELATSVLSVFEKLESIEKVSTSLMQILHPEVVKEVSEKEHFEKVKEKLVSEKEKNNTLATTILTQAEKLTTASSISEKSQILASVKEAVTSESEKQNNLAQFISSQLPGLMQVDTTVSEEKVQVDLEKAQREGNPLAVKLLAVAQETSAEKQKEKLASLQTEIAQEKDKGNKLAIALSDMMTPKPKLAAKPEAFPTTNRIQEVSLDDYEAVKKMWTENYQNLETEDLAGKKQWIEDDVKQIADTTDLLTSEDTEKVEEGMQKVSDILPFLLIGGFSQSEIVAYLKAKQEAGKEVLSDITKQTEEEETTISVERATRVAPKTVTVSATRADDSTEVAEVVSRASVTPIAETVSLPPKLMSPVARQEATHMLRVANIAIPSLRTVASYDETRLSHDAKREQEIAKTRDALRLITNPNLAKDEVTQEHYKEIQETLAKEVEKGNHLAYSIISAGRLLGKLTAESTFTGVLQLAEVLKKLYDPSQISDEKEKEVFQKLSETISFQSNNGNAVAADVYAALRGGKQPLEALLHLREKLLHASADGNIVAQAVLAKTGVVKPDMKKQLDLLMGMYLLVDALTTPGSSLEKNEADGVSGLVTMLKKQAALGNDTARAILAVKEKNDLDQIISLVGRIEEKQDPFTTSLCSSLVKLSTSTPLISTSQSSVQSIVSKVLSVLTHPLEEKNNVSTQALQEKLVAAKQEGNTLATMILAKADEKTKQEIVSLTAILRHIDRPEEGADATQKASYQDLRERLEKEQKNHNGLASEVLSAAHLLTANAVSPLEKTTLSVMLWEKLSEQASANNEVAKTVLSRVEELQAKERLNQLLRDLLVSLAHPERITDEKRKKQLTSLQEALRDGREKGNEIAKLLSDAIEQSSLKKATTNSLDALETQLEKSALAGESLAKEFLSVLREDEKISAYFAIARVLHALVEPNDVVFPEDRDRYKQLHASLQEAAEKDSLVGMSVLAASERIGTQGDDMSEAKKLHELLEHDGSDIAQEVRAQIDNEKRAYDQTLVLRTILHGIMHPEYLPDQKRQQAASVLGKQIALEAQHGNTSSKLIQKILHELDALGESANELTTISHLYSVLRKEKEDGNPRATDILALITAEETSMRAQRLAEVLENIADPKRAPGEEQSEYIKLREALVTAETSGDAIAKLLLSISQAFGAKHVEERDVQSILSLLLEKLTAEKELGNSFAMSILALMKPQEAHEKVDDIEKALIAAKEHDDPIAKAVFAFADTRAEGTLSVDGVVVPAENRVQEVNLDDYEAVRSMWAESYRSLDVPIRVTGEHMSRAAWLQDDIAHMQETIDLLGSTDTAKVNEGMQKVSDILPFLLIGGFSSSEIVAYLKAKLEAAKSVMAELEGEKEQVTVRKDAKVEKTISVDEKSEV